MIEYLQLYRKISTGVKKRLLIVVILMVISSLFELISISAIFPFLAALTNSSQILSLPIYTETIQKFNSDSQEFRLVLGAIFALAVLSAGFFRVLLIQQINSLSFRVGNEIGVLVFRATLMQSYKDFSKRHSSEVISGILTKTSSVIFDSIIPTLNIFSSILIFIAILIPLLYINTLATLSSLFIFGLIYLLIMLTSKKNMTDVSEKTANLSNKLVQMIQESLGSFRDIKLDGIHEVFINLYKLIDLDLRRAQSLGQFMGQYPRYVAESIGMIVMILFALYLVEADGASAAIPLIGLLALAAQRIFPLLQQMYGSWVNLRIGKKSFLDVMEIISTPASSKDSRSIKELVFNREIAFDAISFAYSESTSLIENFSIKIKFGEKVGVIGRSGSGKSTLLDLLMGFQLPCLGSIRVDGVDLSNDNLDAWQKSIAHVPQNVFILDKTIEENIAFGVHKIDIDQEQMKKVIEQSHLTDLIESLPNGILTIVGEGGGHLSGGQKQRIAIARALYKGAKVLVLDEITSALDAETESGIAKIVSGLGSAYTVIMASHSEVALKDFDRVIRMN